jgi:hypothetical protein
MAMNYFYRVSLADVDEQGKVSSRRMSFDSTFVVAGGDGPGADDHDLQAEQDGRNALANIVTSKHFAAALTPAKVHLIHSLLFLEQQGVEIPTDIELFKWDDKIKRNKEGNASLISLANVSSNSKITRHSVTMNDDGYWFYFDIVGGAEFEDRTARKYQNEGEGR